MLSASSIDVIEHMHDILTTPDVVIAYSAICICRILCLYGQFGLMHGIFMNLYAI